MNIIKYQKLSNDQESCDIVSEKLLVESRDIQGQHGCIPQFSFSLSYIANFYNLSFNYFQSLINSGKDGVYVEKDHLLQIPNDMKACNLFVLLCQLWTIEELRNDIVHDSNSKPILWNILHSLIITEFRYAGFCRLLNDIAVVIGAALIKQIVIASVSGNSSYIILIAFAITMNSLFQTIMLSQFVNSAFMCGSKVVSASSTAIFQSTLCLRIERMNPTKSLGEITNIQIQSKDASSLREFVVFAHNLWACPLMIVACASFLLYLLGWAGLVSCVLLPLLIPVESYVSRKCKALRKEALSCSDKRMTLVNELIDGMKTVKLTNMCSFIFEKIRQLRRAELMKAWQFMLLETINTVLIRSGTLVITLLTFTSSNTISADKAFASLALINILGRPMQLIPKCITLLNEAIVSCERIESLIWEAKKFQPDLLRFDLNKLSRYGRSPGQLDDEDLLDNKELSSSSSIPSVIVSDLCVFRSGSQVIRKISVNISGKGLVLVVGNNGSGKDPWIVNDTALENIIIANREHDDNDEDQDEGHSYDPGRYGRVVDQSCLSEDFISWPQMDNTVIGEKGITISGGQRQRISLARSLYSHSNLLLLDSPISGLDVIVAKQVFLNAIVESAKDRLVIMTCHQLEFMPYADRIIALDEGKIIFDGSYETFKQMKSNPFTITGAQQDLIDRKKSSRDDVSDKSVKSTTGKSKRIEKSDDLSHTSNSWRSFEEYIRACKLSNIILCIMLSLSAYAVSALSDFLLAFWTDHKITAQQYILMYIVVSGALICINIARYLMYSYSGITASESMHNRLLQSIMGCTFQFFSTTPSGRISSRFSTDLNQIDFNIPDSLSSFVDAFLGIFTGVGVVVLSAPVYIIIIVPIAWKYMNVQKVYRNIAKDLKKIDSGSVSPLFSFFRETINGLETIRGFKIQNKLIAKHYRLLDASIRARTNWDIANRWMGIRLDLLGSLVVSAAAFSIAFTVSSSHGGQAGLMIAYAMKATQSMTFAIRSSTALENMFTSCDRVKEYIDLDQETSPDELPLQTNCNDSLDEVSPLNGNLNIPIINAIDIVFNYPSSTTPILKGVNFSVCRGKLVGICGRTGSGKSSITILLTRLVNHSSGTLLYEGSDCRDIPLVKYRSAVQVYPQDSYIFSGTLRSFLDPYNLHSDVKMNNIIKDLTNIAKDDDNSSSFAHQLTLEMSICANGSNLSAGQKQVAVLARAALSEANVIILDEITSNMDVESSLKALNIIKNELISKGKSVLLVSHRMNEINICDDVWLMSDGRIVESGQPKELDREGTEYHRMIQSTR